MVNRPAADVYHALADVTRMGEWSPECTGGEWVAPATEPKVGALFVGHNQAKLGPISLNRWQTTCRVTECRPGEAFAFVSEEHTTWRYEFIAVGESTRVTETYEHPEFTGWQRFWYHTVLRRETGMISAMDATLQRLKSALEAASPSPVTPQALPPQLAD